MTKTKGPRPKHIPQRTCIVCRQERGKRELVRVVRAADGTVQVDLTGKLAGRGAYLCKTRGCWDAPGLGQRLGAALKTAVSAEDLVALRAFGATLPVATPVPSAAPSAPNTAADGRRHAAATVTNEK